MSRNLVYIIILIIIHIMLIDGFHSSVSATLSKQTSSSSSHLLSMKENNPNPISRILFQATELFGSILKVTNVIDKSDNANVASNTITIQPQTISLEEIGQRIKKEYENLFWVTGNMEMSLWEDNCTFADPFSSFGGYGSLRRFKSNADNLSRLVENPVSRVTSFEILQEQKIMILSNPVNVDVIKVGWSFSSILKLPWRPMLSASGITAHYISKTSRKIVRYEEAWKSKPLDVVLRLFVPSGR